MIQPWGHLPCLKTAGASLTWTMRRLHWQHVGGLAPHFNLPGFAICAHAVGIKKKTQKTPKHLQHDSRKSF